MAAAWLALGWLTLLSGLGGFGLLGPDEPRYAAIAAAMLRRHDWITPWLWGAPWMEKPVLLYWLAAASDALRGVSAASSRLPNALLAFLLSGALWWFLRKAATPRAGVMAAFLSLTCAFWIGFGRAATTDMTLTVPLSLALMALFRWLRAPQPRWLLACAALLAFATLAKGPVAVALAALVLAGYCAAQRDWSWWRRALRPGPIALFLALAAPWFVAVEWRNPSFFRVFFLQHNLERFATNRFDHPQAFWYYLPILLASLFPWTGWLGLPLLELKRRWREPLRAFLWIWLLVPVVFFSISRSKLPGYILPALPAAVALIAVAADARWEKLPRWPLAISVLLAAAVPMVLRLEPWAVALRSQRVPLGQLLVLPQVWLLGVATAIVMLLLVARRRSAVLIAATCLLMAGGVAALTHRPYARDLDVAMSGRPLARALAAQCEAGLPTRCGSVPLFTWRLNRGLLYSAQFALGEPLSELPPAPPTEAMLLVDQTAVPSLVGWLGGNYEMGRLGRFDPPNANLPTPPWVVVRISNRRSPPLLK